MDTQSLELLKYIELTLKDNQVDIDLKHKIAKVGRALKNGEEVFGIVCLNLTGIITSYVLKHQNNIPKSLDHLYHFVLDKGQRYKALGIGLGNMSSWF